MLQLLSFERRKKKYHCIHVCNVLISNKRNSMDHFYTFKHCVLKTSIALRLRIWAFAGPKPRVPKVDFNLFSCSFGSNSEFCFVLRFTFHSINEMFKFLSVTNHLYVEAKLSTTGLLKRLQ